MRNRSKQVAIAKWRVNMNLMKDLLYAAAGQINDSDKIAAVASGNQPIRTQYSKIDQ